MTATSFFSYSISRHYPAKFTWIILAGGAIVITFFTFVAVAGNAYQLDTKYKNDYNATIANRTWYQRKEFAWATDMETTCQPALLTIGDDHTTTNGGFHYTVASFRHDGNASDIPLTASYRNGSVSDCQVRQIVIELLRKNDGRLPRNFWTWAASYARSTTECKVDTDAGPLRINFTSELPPASRREEITDGFLALNSTEHPGRYIGAQFVSFWLSKLSTAMSYAAPGELKDSNAAAWGSGIVTLTRNDVMDYQDLNFFTVGASFQDDGGGLSSMNPPHTMQHWHDQWTPQAALDHYNDSLPNISTTVDALAKSYYSLLLSDFNSTEEIKQTNALSTRQGIEYLQNRTDVDLADVTKLFTDKNDKEDGTIGRAYNPATVNLTQPLDFAEHTTIFSQYLCSVPRPKSTFKLLFAVAVADLVFLGTCWRIFGWVAGWWLDRRDERAQYCKGCANAIESIPLAHAPGNNGGGGGGGGSYSQVSSDAGDESGVSQVRLSAPKIARAHSGV